MSSVSFVIPGRIRGKGRPRSAIQRGKSGRQFVQVYTDKDTMNCEALIRSLAAEAMGCRPPLDGPLVLDVSITLNTPPSWSKKKRAQTFHVTGKPDIDNIAKICADSISGICFGDDVQLCELHIRRRYDDTAGESVTVKVYPPTDRPWAARKVIAASDLFRAISEAAAPVALDEPAAQARAASMLLESGK